MTGGDGPHAAWSPTKNREWSPSPGRFFWQPVVSQQASASVASIGRAPHS